MTSPLRAAVVGAGLMGRWHAEYLSRIGVRIDAILDRDVERARGLASRHRGAKALSVEQEWPDTAAVVHLCTPLESHAELIGGALDRGLHVVCEKPLAGCTRQVHELHQKARQRERMLLPVHQFPFQAGVRRIQERLDRLGTLRALEFRTATAGAEGRDADGRRAVLLEILAHPISLFSAFAIPTVDPAAWSLLEASTDRLRLETATAQCRLGIEIDLVSRPTRNELLVTGDRASATADLYHGYSVFDTASADRSGKLVRPLLLAARVGGGAVSNLLKRSLRRETAYPGLLDLFRWTYSEIGSGRLPEAEAECLATAALMERVESEIDQPARTTS